MNNLKKSEFDEVFNLMQQSFPENEYRTYEKQLNLLSINEYRILTKHNEKGSLTAFIAIWDFPKFIFIEHLAVNPICRGEGLGTKIMKEVIKTCGKPVILEIEPPTNEISIKRCNFYKRLGFNLCDYEYYQQPLRKNQNKLKLNLMSYPDPLDKNKFDYIRSYLMEHVYNAFN